MTAGNPASPHRASDPRPPGGHWRVVAGAYSPGRGERVAIHSVDLGHLPFGGTASVIGCGPGGWRRPALVLRR